MNDKETISFLRNIGKKLDESELRIKKVEDQISYDPKKGLVFKGPIHYSGNLYPSPYSDIGSTHNFINNLYMSGKIIYPDVLDFGVNNDFRIDKMGKIGFHANTMLDGVTIKGLNSFVIQNVRYLGENTLLFQISNGSIEDFITRQDVLIIELIQYQVINLQRDRVEIEQLNGEKCHLEAGNNYDLVVYGNILGIKTLKDEDVLKINAVGDLFYKTSDRKADINIGGSVNCLEIFSDHISTKKLIIDDPDYPIVPNLNAEFLCGKKGPENGDIVSTKDKQQIWNKSFGDDLVMNYNRIVNLNDPLFECDAVNKRYVDRYLSGLKIAPSVKCVAIEWVEGDYEKRTMKFYLRSNDGFDSENIRNIFDGYSLRINERCILLNQQDQTQNGVYIVVEDGLDSGRKVLQRVEDFCKRKTGDELKSYYTFIENGIKYGNTGVCFEYVEDFEWDESPINFNVFSRAESYGVGNGIKKTRNNFSLNISEEFNVDTGKLELKRNFLGNEYFKNPNFYIINEGGLDIDKSVINLGDSLRFGLKINRKQFHFGKNGELQISSFLKNDDFNKEELNINKSVSTTIFQNVYQLFPPKVFTVQLQYSEDFFEKEKDRVVQYFICSLNSEGKETSQKIGDEIYFTEEAKSVFATIEWELVNGCEGYIVYKRINSAYWYVKLSPVETNLLDILVPKNFTKIDWKPCQEPENMNKTVLVVNKFSTLGSNFITSGGLGIGTISPKSALHIVSNEVNSEGVPLIIECGEKDKESLRLIKKGISDGGGVKIVGECMEGNGLLELGKNIRLIADAEGVIFLGRGDETIDINEKLGSDAFTVQTTDGGLYSVGDIMAGESKSFGCFNSKIGNNAAILKTGCVSTSIANEVCFTWEGEELKAVPMYDGNMLTKKKVSVKNFTIQHPTKNDKYLVHACLEGPTADVFYRGKGEVALGTYFVDIKLPEYFCKIIEMGSSTVHLTPIGFPFFRLGGSIYEAQNILRVYLDNVYGETACFYWEVKGKRINTDFEVEPNKSDLRVYGMGPYTYYL